MIFVSISSYCDPELIPTIKDCVANAMSPEELRIVVCWQHQPGDDDPSELRVAPALLHVIDVPYMEAKGCCWARQQTQEFYNGESWFLQLDSHHRFTHGWDVSLHQQAIQTRSPKPILGSYCTEYQIGPPEVRMDLIPQVMMVTRCTSDGVILFRGGLCESWLNVLHMPPQRARFTSGHFLFAPGSFVTDVPADPEVYFTGEEIMLPARGFSHGYDLFHPSRAILYHEYTRQARPKHWDHHTQWHVQSNKGERHVLDLLTRWPIGRLEFGTVRSKADYEAYTGLDFTNWTASDAARAGREPPPIRKL